MDDCWSGDYLLLRLPRLLFTKVLTMTIQETLNAYGDCIMPFGPFKNAKLRHVSQDQFDNLLHHPTMVNGPFVGKSALWFYTIARCGLTPDQFKEMKGLD